MGEKLRRALPALAALTLFVVALGVLRSELGSISWPALRADVMRTPAVRLWLALALTGVNYAALSCYDLLAFASIGKRLPRRRIVMTSLLAYAVSNNVGFAMLSGASVRYRFYSRWGVTATELSCIVFAYSLTFWLGLLGLGGLSLVLAPTGTIAAAGLAVPAGWCLLAVPAAYLVVTAVRRRPLRIGPVRLPLPSTRIAAGQVAVSAVDWVLAGAVLYVLLPAHALGFLAFLGAFLLAILLGNASHVPGGVGVFEGVMVLLLKPYLPSSELLPALVVYRAVYFLLPFAGALVALLSYEAWHQRAHGLRARAVVERCAERITPRLTAVLTFLAGVVLLLSGSTPAATGRLEALDRFLPLGVIEASHFLGSVIGVLLLILSLGLARRLDAACYFTMAAIVAGVAASMLKGIDYEEASALLLVLTLLVAGRRSFDRRAAFFDMRLSPRWVAAITASLAASVWLGLFAFQHVRYSDQLWWQFELHGDASRFMRASVGVAVVVLAFAFARLIAFAPHDAPPPTDADLADAAQVIAGQTSTVPYLAYLGDKALLFNDDRRAFLMYAVQGRTWVALGDPVGPIDAHADLIRRFLERCDDFGGVPVFYQVGRAHLHHYADVGLSFVKLGEEARVDLTTFTLQGGGAARFRQALRRLDKSGASFLVAQPDAVPPMLTELGAVSREWLAAKRAAEKGFSLGFFTEPYVSRFPIAVITRAGRIEAFANLWPGPRHEELSIDLMRYRHDAPPSIMETLLVHLLAWARDQGYHWFALGMAPLAGVEASPIAPLWNRIGALVYAHGEALYGFRGLRAFKEKFNPTWEPRYLAYPGGLRLPRVTADVSALIAGGYRHLLPG